MSKVLLISPGVYFPGTEGVTGSSCFTLFVQNRKLGVLKD